MSKDILAWKLASEYQQRSKSRRLIAPDFSRAHHVRRVTVHDDVINVQLDSLIVCIKVMEMKKY